MTAITSMLVSGTSQIKSPLGDPLPKFQKDWKQYRVHWAGCRVGNGENKLVAKAGLGRCSGAIHGSRLHQKARRRHPSEISQVEDNDREPDILEDHGAQARGAYGDDFEDEGSLTDREDYIERDDESLVDRFHSDGTSDNPRDETQLRVSYSRDTYDEEQEKAPVIVDDSIRQSNLAQHFDERNETPNVITGTGKETVNVVLSRSEQPGASSQEHCASGVEAVTVFDGSGKATVSEVQPDLHSEQLPVANNGAGVGDSATEKASSNSGRMEEVMEGTKQCADDEEVDRQQSERGTDTSGVPVLQSAMESKGEIDGSRNGSTRPSLQRRSSRGRKRKPPSRFGNEPPPVISFSEDVASGAATILKNSEAAGSNSEVSPSKSGREPGLFAAQEMGGRPFYKSKLRAYDSNTIAQGAYGVSDLLANSDNMRVRTPSGEAERPAQLPGSLAPASATAVVLERPLEHVADLQPAVLDMNQHNGHINRNTTAWKKEKNSPGGISQLVRPKRPHDPKSLLQESAQERSKDVLVADSVGTAEKTFTLATVGDTTSTTPPSASFPLKLITDLPVKVVKDLPSKIPDLPVKVVKDLPGKVAEIPIVKDLPVVKEIPAKISEIPTVVAEIPTKIVVETVQKLKSQVVEPVAEILPDSVVEQMGAVVEQVSSQVDEVSSKVSEQVAKVSNQVSESVSSTAAQVTHSVTSTVSDVAESVQSTAAQVTETVQTRAAQVTESVSSTATKVSSKAAEVSSSIVDFLTFDDESASDDEFETFKTSDSPEFRGMQGLQNYQVLQDGQGMLFAIYDFYIYMLKKPLPQFACGMFAAPILLSVVFTLLYMPDCQGLALDETARTFFNSAAGDDASTGGLTLSWMTLFQVFMFSLSLSTGLQPELSPLSPYTLVLANINALFAQLIFVFLSGAVFARLSQPSQPVRCSNIALVCPSHAQRRRRVDSSATKVLMARYVLVGPQPCELVDVKVDFTYKYNTLTRSGSFFRATQSLKLVRSEIAYLNQGMLVRHIIDESSPLYRRTPEMLLREDAIFTLSVVGLERSSMQSVFHVQHYCVCDNHVIWDAEFEDMMLISKKNKRIVDHSKLSLWRSL